MAWTYGGNLATSNRDLVRFLLGDVTQTPISPQDSEVDYWITKDTDADGNVDAYKAASEIASALANRYATKSTSDVKIGGMSLKYDYQQMAAQYRDLAERLLAGRTSVSVGAPTWNDTIPSSFGMGLMDHP